MTCVRRSSRRLVVVVVVEGDAVSVEGGGMSRMRGAPCSRMETAMARADLARRDVRDMVRGMRWDGMGWDGMAGDLG